jgi:glycoprotein endo-alpha-1,2-mannosidase
MPLKTIMPILIVLIMLVAGCDDEDKKSHSVSVKQVQKTNPTKVYMHYMPWFQSKEITGYWGSHWKMKNRNPDIMDDSGKREIASHYYPLIGPYDSKDSDVLKYHVLLMKYAGVDGLLIDWYGSHNVYDYRANLTGTNAIIKEATTVGLQFGIVYEEYVAGNIANTTSKTALQAAQADLQYAEKEYFSKPEYIHINNAPLLLTFGPRYFKVSTQWIEIFSALRNKPTFIPLWNHAGLVGTTGNGEFAWVDFNESLKDLTSFYNKVHLEVSIGSAYPRFHDYYEEGGEGTSYGYVDAHEGATFSNTLAMATERKAKYLQLVTWNDYGEGTVLEPTQEDGFLFLTMLQEFTGVPYGERELVMIHDYYQKLKEHKSNGEHASTLQKIFDHLNALEVEQARQLLETL